MLGRLCQISECVSVKVRGHSTLHSFLQGFDRAVTREEWCSTLEAAGRFCLKLLYCGCQPTKQPPVFLQLGILSSLQRNDVPDVNRYDMKEARVAQSEPEQLT